MVLTIDKFGRMVLPKTVRDDFNIRPGDAIDLVETEEAIILKPLSRQGSIKESGGIKIFTGTATGNIEKATEALREDRLDRATAWNG